MKLGNIVASAGLTKSNLMDALKLGAGAAAFPFVYGFIQSNLLLKASSKTFAQNTPGEYIARALSGVVLGTLTSRLAKQPMAGDGMMASAVGSVFKDLLAGWMNPAAGAAQSVVKAEEQMSGIGQMTAMNPMGRGLAGLGAISASSDYDNLQLFGVGTPDMRAAGMFNGATVAIEQPGFSGATVAIESNTNFAGALS